MVEPRLSENDAAPLAAPADDSAAAPAPEAPGVVRQAVRAGGLRLLFDFSSTSKLSELVPITPVPATPQWLRGLASVHGIVLPVLDIAALLKLERTPATRTMLLVVGHGESAAAILIDGLPDRYRFEDAARVSAWRAPDLLSDCIRGAYTRGSETWLDVDHRRFLDRIEERIRTSG